jgi:hypothetical protein
VGPRTRCLSRKHKTEFRTCYHQAGPPHLDLVPSHPEYSVTVNLHLFSSALDCLSVVCSPGVRGGSSWHRVMWGVNAKRGLHLFDYAAKSVPEASWERSHSTVLVRC